MLDQLQDQLADLKQKNMLAQVARHAGIAERTIYRIANGDTRDSRISTITKVLIAVQAVRSKLDKASAEKSAMA